LWRCSLARRALTSPNTTAMPLTWSSMVIGDAL